MMKRLLALVLLLMPLWGWAQACPFWHVITFSDGKTGCLTDYPIARLNPVGSGIALKDLVNVGTVNNAGPGYAVALSRGAQCPRGVVSLSTSRSREEDALAACNSALRKVTSNDSCTCQVAVVTGRSNMTKSAFETLANVDGAAAAVGATAPAAVAAAPAPAAAAASTQVPLHSKPTAELTDEEIRALLRPALALNSNLPSPATPPAASPPEPQQQPPAAEVQSPTPPPESDELLKALQKRIAELEATRVPAAPAGRAGQAPRLSARALVIGNSRYTSFGRLANPQRDATAIAAKLRSYGIPVDLVLDAQRDDLIHALNEHSRQAAGKDISIFFYAGHGVQVEGINYLIPVNMRADGISSGYVKLAGISLNAALDYLPAKTRLVFLDACRDNPASRTLVSTRSAGSTGLAPVSVASGTLLSYATRDGATADDGTGLHSPYTTALLQHLDSPVDISLVLRQVRQTVLQLTSGRQEPWEYGSLVGDQIVLPLLSR